jgi:cytochrome c biogenesis protein CcdA
MSIAQTVALTWKVTGLPLHPLVVHAAVVFAPLAAATAIAYVVLPKYRDLLRWPTLVVVLIAFGSIWAAYLTGNNFFSDPRFTHFSGEILDRIHKHQSYARTLRWIMTGFAIVTVAATYLHDEPGTRRTVLGALVVLGAVLTLVWTVLTGDAGARAVWS